ncbi:MAG: sigma-70 family RNA polymerase sigma factor [Planctomycetota bacterium]
MSASHTRQSLLSQLRHQPDNSDSWAQFVDIYQPKITRWCLGWGLQRSDADDVAQNVLLAMSRQMKEFKYDPSGRFRAWLKTVSYRAWVDFVKSKSRQPSGTGSDELHDVLAAVETRDSFVANMDAECEREMLEHAMLVVRRRVNEHNWKAFYMTVFDGIPGVEVAKQLGMAVTAVYKARSRIQEMLKEQVDKMDRDRG